MTGLEKILKAIEADSTANAADTIAKAKEEADTILAIAKSEAESRCAEIAAKSEKDVKAILSRAESSALLQERKVILEEKQRIINDMIDKAMVSLRDVPKDQYVEILLKMIRKSAHRNEGQIIFSEQDKKDLPSDFQQKINDVLAEKQGASLKLSDETIHISGGFILKYGEIEENCSFQALFAEAKEELQDKVNVLLFD